jgi:hypothetical protein
LAQFRAERPQADIIAEFRPDGSLTMIGPNRDPRGGDGAILISFAPESEQVEPLAPEPAGFD